MTGVALSSDGCAVQFATRYRALEKYVGEPARTPSHGSMITGMPTGLLSLVLVIVGLGLIVLGVWIGYLILKAAVKNGVLAAAEDPRAAGVVARLAGQLGTASQLPSGPAQGYPQVPPGR